MPTDSLASQSSTERHVSVLLGIFLFLLIYDGALRKWLFPGAEKLIFIAKDALLFLALGYLLFVRPRIGGFSLPRPVAIASSIYGLWVLCEALNPKLPSPLVGLWGAKVHLFYACMIILVPIAFQNLTRLLSWLSRAYPWVVVPVCTIAWIQFYSPADSLINLPVRGGVHMVSPFGESGHIRSTGTFSFITGMGFFLQAAAIVGFTLLMRRGRSPFLVLASAFVLATVPTNGSRGVMYVIAMALGLIFVGALYSRLVDRKAFIYLAVALGVFLLGSVFGLEAAWEAIIYRIQTSYTTAGDSQRYFTVFSNAFDFFRIAGLFGYGSGATSQAAPFLVSAVEPYSWLPSGIFFEDESGRIVLELGAAGWFISLTMRLSFLAWALYLSVRGTGDDVRWAALLALPVMILGSYVGNGVFAPPVGGVFYWFCIALLAMAQYEHRANVQAVKIRMQGA